MRAYRLRTPDYSLIWEITYRFAGSPNRTGLVVGPMTGIAKKGWEYIWVRYADRKGTVTDGTLQHARTEKLAPTHKLPGVA